jgi:DNA-binding NtrC family response regulator
MFRHWPILVVDDEDVMRVSLSAWLREDGYSVDTADSGQAAIEMVRQREYAIFFIDLKMPRGPDGIETMRAIRQIHPDSSVIIITAYASVDTAILAMKEGAQEYIVKPCNPTEISLMVSRIIRMKNLQRENVILRKKLARQYEFQDLLSKNPRMHEIFELIREIADLRSNVLIHGESGTGKELVARAIHNSGTRARRRFVAVPCAALAETLLESELFGYEKGSFTGAQERKKGKIELADGGTLFLDEIGDISPKLQVDLLRVLQERKFYRVGGSDEVSVDVRVIAATRVDLRQAMREGKFRDDLFYRLNVVTIHIPPLRERREDIPLLARDFMVRLGHEMGRDMDDISSGALKLLLDYDWAGNVRELENAVERAIITARGRELTEADFGFLARQDRAGADWQAPGNMSLADVEKQVIIATLQRLGGNIKAAAASLGIDRSTLYERIRKLGLPVERRKGALD